MQPEKVSGIDMTLLEKFSGFNWGGAALRCEQSQIAGACPRLARVLRTSVVAHCPMHRRQPSARSHQTDDDPSPFQRRGLLDQRKDGDGRPMTGRNEQRRDTCAKRYEICVGGHLGELIRTAFPDLRVQVQGRDTVLSGVLADQAALYGVLRQVEALGLELIAVRRVP